MKKIKKSYKSLKKECNICRSNLEAWLSSFNYNSNKEEAIKSNINNYCPVCITSENLNHKSRI